jgi:AcrR family transcriptional regulator
MPRGATGTRRTRADRRLEARHKLLIAVERLLAEEDATFSNISLDRLAQESGVARSSLYLYFKTKGDIILELTEDVVGGLLESARAWWELPDDAGKDDLRQALGNLVDAYVPHHRIMSAVVETATYDEGVRARFASIIAPTISAFSAYIRAGQARGAVTARIDPDRTAIWMTWMLERGLQQLVAKSSGAGLQRELDALTDIVWNVLYAEARGWDR